MYPNVNNAPGKEEVENFWRNIHRKKISTYWRGGLDKKNQYQQTPSMEWRPICEKDVVEALRTTLNWKTPGRDQIPNFWLKQLTTTHKHIAAIFNKLTEEDQIPKWLTAGVTFLIPKNANTENPNNYRPVTCLPKMYKLITSVISRCIQKYMDDENLIPKEQKGCYRESKECKDQLLFSKAILQESKRSKKFEYGMDWLSESLWQGATQLDNKIARVNWD